MPIVWSEFGFPLPLRLDLFYKEAQVVVLGARCFSEAADSGFINDRKMPAGPKQGNSRKKENTRRKNTRSTRSTKKKRHR